MKEERVSPKNRIALTIDVEDWYHLPPITGAPTSKFKDVPSFFNNWHSTFDYLSKPTYRTLAILQELDLKATFFVVADIVQNYPGLIQNIAADGHEIACHGLHHACKIDPKTKKPLMSKTEFKENTIKAKTILESASGQEVIGYRAPNAYIAGWMTDILDDIGFKYDSSVSVNSFYNKSDSLLKNVDTRPYYPEKYCLEPRVRKRGFLEMPWPYFKFIAKFPTGGGPILRILGARYLMKGLKESLQKGDTIFYFHPIDICTENFPLNSSLIQRLFWATKGHTVEKRIKGILLNTRQYISTCRQLYFDKVELDGN